MRSILEVQDQLRGALMAQLLKEGVSRQDFSSEDFFREFESDFQDIAGFDELFVDMLIWLRDEGIIRYDSLYGGTADETCVSLCSPTARAMAELDSEVPGDSGRTVRDIATLSDETSYTNYGRLGAFFGGLIGGYQGTL